MSTITLPHSIWRQADRVARHILLTEDAQIDREIAKSIIRDQFYTQVSPDDTWVILVHTARRWFIELSKTTVAESHHETCELRKFLLAKLIDAGVQL